MTEKPSESPTDDELHRKFREALAKKNAQHEARPGTGQRGEGVGDAHNDKHQRQFRRKSGG
jgi:hypothetical protein